MAQATIQPIDDFVRDGFAQQIKKQFRAPAVYTTSVDKLKVLQLMLGNVTPEYPYIFLNITNMSPNTESYNAHRLVRMGVPVTLNTDNNQYQLVRLIPTNFEIEITFVTNKYAGDLESVQGFVRRWLSARRNGAMQFNIEYGLLQASISYTLVDSIPLQPRENPADSESVYQVVTSATLKGYVSEPELGTRGRINQFQFGTPNAEQLEALGITSTSQTINF